MPLGTPLLFGGRFHPTEAIHAPQLTVDDGILISGTLGGETPTAEASASFDEQTMLVARLEQDGRMTWLRPLEASPAGMMGSGIGVAVAENGSAIMMGDFWGDTTTSVAEIDPAGELVGVNPLGWWFDPDERLLYPSHIAVAGDAILVGGATLMADAYYGPSIGFVALFDFAGQLIERRSWHRNRCRYSAAPRPGRRTRPRWPGRRRPHFQRSNRCPISADPTPRLRAF